MEMTSAKAMLVDPDDLDAGDAVTTTIPRAAIEEALASSEPTDLYLEVVRPAAAGAPDSATVSVAWERPDLERLLLGTSSDAVTFSFRASELERALEDPEFEGHGLRETAAVLAVAAAAAASVSSAAAKPMDAGGTPAGSGGTEIAAVHQDTIADARTGPVDSATAGPETVIPYLSHGQGVDESQFAGTQQAAEPSQVIPYLSHGQGVDESQFAGTPSGTEAPAAEPSQVIPYLSHGQGVDESQFSGVDTGPATVHDEALAAARTGDITPTTATTHDEATLAARGIETAPTHDEATLAARGIDTPAVHDEATLAARGIETPAPADTGSGFELPSVDPGVAAAVGGAAGGAALLIAAAAFAARGRRPMRPV
jgi:hypothetical protein